MQYVPILVGGEMPCNHQGMTVWARVLNWVRVHPWFAALAGLGIWVSGAAAVDVLETLDVWHPGGQATELLGGLFGLPLTGVAVVVLFDHLERARWSPLLDRRRRTARGHLAALSLKVASLFDWRVQLSANHPRVPLTREPIVLSGNAVGDPAIETIELLHSALIELEPGAEEYDLMRSIEWEEKRVSFPATRSAHLAVHAQTVIDIGKDMLRRQDATEAVSVENLYVVLDDVRSLSTDPQEIEAIDSLLAAVRSWVRCHPTSKTHHERARSICEDALRMKRAFDSGESHNNQEMVIVKVVSELSTWSDFETEIASAHHLLGLLAKLWPEPTPTKK